MRFFLILPLALTAGPAIGADGPDFDAVVAPILVKRCIDCHAGFDAKAGLDLSSRESAMKGGDTGPAIVAGKPEESLLWEVVADGSMPPKAKIDDAEKAALRAWIAAGAKWGTDPIRVGEATSDRRAGLDWWSLRPVVRPEVPTVAGRVENPIDAFVLHDLKSTGLAPSPRADRRTLARRVTFDLIGLPPTPEEVDAFVADDRPDAYARLVDRLLGSPQYGVRWARPWLDIARFGESHGFEHDEFRPNAWRYRDWVVNALNSDMAYDMFARLQVAGDVLRPSNPDAIEATGFVVAGAYDSVGQGQISAAMKKVVREDEMEDVVGTVGQAFLGLTIHCARCHDHKFDPIRQAEYYRVESALAGVRHGERDLTRLDPEVPGLERTIAQATERIAAIEAPARTRLNPGRGPLPVAGWDFASGLDDRVGSLHVKTQGMAGVSPGGLKLDGKVGFAATVPLERDLTSKTLEAWVKLDDLGQGGGGVIGVESRDGGTFDTIVFGEREPARWMAGSENFARYKPFDAPAEADAKARAVHLAITYAADGTVSSYRDGKPYGRPYKTSPPPMFRAGEARVVFGIRHTPPTSNKMLAGTIVRARLYDRALSAAEIATTAAKPSDLAPTAAVVATLTTAERDERGQRLAAIESARAELSRRIRKAYVVVPRPPGPIPLLSRGNPGTPAGIVAPGGIAAVSGPSADFGLPPDAPDADRRARFVAWMTDPKNPLFARVIVNRTWQGHFGAGFVETPSDFGFNGGKPSHPDLLDWLASELIARGWSLKALHRLILTSSTYQQSSRPDPAAMKVDAGSRKLWRKAPARLEAEMVRDAMLAVSGALDDRLGGPGFREFDIHQAKGTISIQYLPIAADGPETARRTLYRTWARGGRSGFLDAFDCPDPSAAAPRRAVTTTPQQALALLNGPLTLRLADRFADRLAREAGPDPARQAERAYRLALGRAPDPDERAAAAEVAAKFGASALARAIFNSNEFLYVD